jgi:hypothetical protein
MGLLDRLREQRAKVAPSPWFVTGDEDLASGPLARAIGDWDLRVDARKVELGHELPDDDPLWTECPDQFVRRAEGVIAAEHNAMGPILDALAECRERLVYIEDRLSGQGRLDAPSVEARRVASLALMALSRLDASSADTTGTLT